MKFFLVFLVFLVFFSCSRFPEEEIKRAKLEIEAMYYAEVPKYLPEEWGLIKDVWQKIDEAERKRDGEAALLWYNYIMQKTLLYEDMLAEKKKEEELLKRQKEEERRRLLELERQKMLEQKETTPQKIVTLPEEKKAFVVTKPKKKSLDDIRYKIEKRFPSFYTVREEESLEEIAELPSIYNDRYYWPLIYKSNRNQVRDPKKLYKGQILKIPRNITMEEIYKAREEARAKSPRVIPKTAFTQEKYKKYKEELLSED